MVNEKKLLKWQALAGDVKTKIEEGTAKAFDVYLRELVKWNRRFNLTGIKDPVEIQIKNFQDSMAVSKLIPRRILSLVDIGSGAGFPGLVLKILLPQLLVYLVEPNAHRYNFLCHIKRVLRLAGLEIYKGSIEKWFSEFENVWRTMSPLYISRAWKKPEEVVRSLASKNISPDSGIILMLGAKGVMELVQLVPVLKVFDLKVTGSQKVILTGEAGTRLNVLLHR